jgi:hypothetical protein
MGSRDCDPIVIKNGANQEKTEQIQKNEIGAILRLVESFSRVFCKIANRRILFFKSQGSNGSTRIRT